MDSWGFIGSNPQTGEAVASDRAQGIIKARKEPGYLQKHALEDGCEGNPAMVQVELNHAKDHRKESASTRESVFRR